MSDRTIAKPTPSPDDFYLKNTTQLNTLTPEPDNSTTHTDGTDDHSNETTGDDNQEVPTIASCLCPCSCAKKSEEEINAMIQDIVTDLKIEKNTTALGRRRLSSVADTRWVSRGLGYVGILVMTVVFGSIALADYRKFLNSYRLFMKNFRKRKPAVNYSSDQDQIRQNSVSE